MSADVGLLTNGCRHADTFGKKRGWMHDACELAGQARQGLIDSQHDVSLWQSKKAIDLIVSTFFKLQNLA